MKDYKVVIFSKEALPKVLNVLQEHNIAYEVFNETSYAPSYNNYEKMKNIAYQSLDKELRVNALVAKINSLSGSKLIHFLEYLEAYSYE